MPQRAVTRARRRRSGIIRPLPAGGRNRQDRLLRPSDTYSPRVRRDNSRDHWTPRAPSAPSAPGVGSPAAPAAPQPLVDDAQSVADRAALRFRTQGQITGSLQESAYDRTDMQEALRRMRAQRPLDEQTTKEGANREGLFYSGQLGKRLDTLATEYARREGDTNLEFERREASRAAARQALEQGLPIEEAAINAALVDRQGVRDQDAADADMLAPSGVGSSRTNNSAVQALASRGAVRANGLGGGVWNVRFAGGALRKLRQRGGRWQVQRNGRWVAF